MHTCSALLLGFTLLTTGQTGADSPAPAAPPSITDGLVLVPLPGAAPPAATAVPTVLDPDPTPNLSGLRHHYNWPMTWGFAQSRAFYAGTRMAPNGNAYHPLFALDLNINFGLLPNKKLYLYTESSFWGQCGTPGQTHGNFDFTKREFDLTTGIAWNYYGPLEFRFLGYAANNLNRGLSLLVPYGFNDGIGFENRYYLPTDDIYDLGRLSFLSIGYLPSKTLIGGDGVGFKPGLFARAYLTYDLGIGHSYAYFDGQLYGQSGFAPRLLSVDAGIAARPFVTLDGLEFRMGGSDILDVQTGPNRGLGYFAVRFLW